MDNRQENDVIKERRRELEFLEKVLKFAPIIFLCGFHTDLVSY